MMVDAPNSELRTPNLSHTTVLLREAVEHVNFAILPSLVEAKKRLQSFGGDLRLAALSDYLKNIFKSTNVLEEFQVFDTAQQAAKSFGVSKPITNLPLGL